MRGSTPSSDPSQETRTTKRMSGRQRSPSARPRRTLTWERPASIVYGTALSATQLNATANVPGTFAYTPAAGTILTAGSSHALSAQFTPTDAVNYNAAAVSTTIDVTKAAATVAVTGGSFTYDGQPHPATGTATGAGGAALSPLTFTYNGQAAGAGERRILCRRRFVRGRRQSRGGVWHRDDRHRQGCHPSSAGTHRDRSSTARRSGQHSSRPRRTSLDRSPTRRRRERSCPRGIRALGATFVPADASNYTTGAVGTTVAVAPRAARSFAPTMPASGSARRSRRSARRLPASSTGTRLPA